MIYINMEQFTEKVIHETKFKAYTCPQVDYVDLA